MLGSGRELLHFLIDSCDSTGKITSIDPDFESGDPSSKMKVLLKMKGKELFLADEEVWTASVAEARAFASSFDLTKFCNHHEIEDAEILFSFNDPQFNFVIGVPKRPRAQQ